MRQKTTTFLALIFCCCWGFGQEILWRKSLAKAGPDVHIAESFQVINSENDDIAMFLKSKQNVLGYLLDSLFRVKASMSSFNLPAKYNTIIGSSVEEDKNYYLYLTNNRKKKFGIINFSFGDGGFETKELDLKLKDEKFVQTFKIDNHLIVLTVTKFSSVLNLYYFDGFQFTVKKVDMEKLNFLSNTGKKSNLYSMLTTAQGLANNVDIEKIDENTPHSIESVSALTKIYREGDNIIVTFDEYDDYTQILTLNLLSLEYDLRSFYKPLSNYTLFNRKKTNTFKFRDKLFAFVTTSDRMIFTVNDYKTGELIKEFTAKEDDTIYFKNTPIVQEGGIYDSYREMEKTKKFLRKATSSTIGIAVYERGDRYHIALGGKQKVAAGGMGMFPMFGAVGGVANFATANVFYNPGFFAFHQYNSTKSVYINGLFDNAFEHINGVMDLNVFDMIKQYKEENEDANIKGETLFRYKDYFILGGYSDKTKSYELRRFKD
ncbi:hypothetical protein [Sinomicrobium sp. M5D2P17]